MTLLKKMALVSCVICSASFGAANDYKCVEEYNEDELLNELITNKLREAGVDANLCFCGNLNLTTLFVSQSEKEDKDDAATSLQGDVNLKYLGRCNKYGYGFEIGAKANSGIIKQSNSIIEVSYLFWESDNVGIVKLGYTNTAADSFNIGGDKFLVGYQGAGSGNFRAFYNPSAGSIVDMGCPFDDGKSAKIAWLSPVVSGFSAGISFTLDSRDTTPFRTMHERMDGIHNEKEHSTCAFSKNVITAGGAYEFGAPDDFNAKIAIAGWFGTGKSNCGNIEIHNVRAYNIGVSLGYQDLRMSLGYTDNGKSFLSTKYATQDIDALDLSGVYDINNPMVGLKGGADAGKIYSIGVAYSFDKLSVSAGYFKSITKFSDNERAKADIVTVAAEYTFNRALAMYAEYDNISTNTCKRAIAYSKVCDLSSHVGKSRANIFMIGTKINF